MRNVTERQRDGKDRGEECVDRLRVVSEFSAEKEEK